MRKLGIVGGTSWHSTATYYQLLNQGVARAVGGVACAPLVLENLDFAAYRALNLTGHPRKADTMVVAAANRLAAAGAEAILLASNTLHRAAGAVTRATGLDVIDIREVTAARIEADGLTRIAMMGTAATMDEPFARKNYEARGIVIHELAPAQKAEVDRVIHDELVLGRVVRDSQRALKTMISDVARARVQAIVLACTELAMAVDARANILPVYDTTALHAAAAVDWILGIETRGAAADEDELLLTADTALAAA